MFQVGEILISDEVLTERFQCDLSACKGACCIEGDAGAPVELEEVARLEEVLPVVWDDLSPKARQVIREQGVVYPDRDGQLVTSIVDGKDCVFTCYDRTGCCYCAIDKAWREGKTAFRKPVSCHLYPIRVSRIGDTEALNYHRWSVCKAAVMAGAKSGTRVYEFLKEPLIRKFGAEWYSELEEAVKELIKRKYIE